VNKSRSNKLFSGQCFFLFLWWSFGRVFKKLQFFEALILFLNGLT
jgi:hypothetical protein